MTRSRFVSLAIVSAVALPPIALHGARPHYGGTLRVEMPGAIRTFDPVATPADATEAAARMRVLPLVFETLVALDPAGGLRPLLATSWAHEASSQRWRFRLRDGVALHDGSHMQAAQVAAALRTRGRAWKVGADGDTLVIDLERPQHDLPWDLVDIRYAIGIRTTAGDLIGSGPFRLEPPGQRHQGRIVLRAHEDHWGGRPFVDAVSVTDNRAFGDAVTSLELGQADFVAIRPTDLRRLGQRGLRSAASRPLETFVLVFEPHRVTAADDRLRRAVSSSIDRAALSTVLLQRQAEPARALLPSWLSGYPPMFQDALPGTAAPPPSLEQRQLMLRVDAGDPLAQAVAERVAVDAREAGITIKVQAPAGLAPKPDVRLVRVGFDATTPDRALAAVMTTLGSRTTALATSEAAPAAGAPIDAVYRIERALVDRDIIVPIVHLPVLYGLGERLESWNGPAVSPTGAWNLANVWLRSDPQ